ncbi:MAG: response regulator transcription factor [bacterium]
MPVIRVVLADDHKMLREGLRILLEHIIEVKVVGEAENGWQAIITTGETNPDIVIMDVNMPGMDGIEATAAISHKYPHVKIIALSVRQDPRGINDMISAGASAFVLKTNAFHELEIAIREVMNNKVYLSPQIADTDLLNKNKGDILDILSNRERDVMKMLASGMKSSEVGNDLGISSRTVDVHRQHIFDKLKINSTADMVRIAIREGLSDLD